MADERWDRFSERYDNIFLENPLYHEAIKVIVSRLEGCDGHNVLEIGCGTGNLMQSIVDTYPDVKLTGVDPSEGMREKCALKFGGDERIEIREGEAEHISYPSGHFSFIVANYALHHIPPAQMGAMVREIARVLRPGGLFINSDFYIDTDAPPPDKERAREIIEKITAQALYYLDHDAYEAALLLMDSLPAGLRADGEYFSTAGRWIELLKGEGFDRYELSPVGPEQFGLAVIIAVLE